ncbi:tetratricopeptide repeat protein [Vibrio sp. TRT 21S02]|uniref:tetratricopeptide repeat protein n=1 Tax=Vibrio sp. TRT 21S02 TaxID=3418507 RepID=UPI003CFB94FD
MKKILGLLLSVGLFSGCTSVNTELATKERLLLGSGDDEKLVEFYKSNLQNEPDYRVKLVNLYLDMKDVKSAELYSNTYSDSELDEPEYILTVARLNYQKKRFDAAKKELEKYLDEGGEDYEYALLTGKILARQKRFDDAIKQFEESRKLGASDREARNNISVVKMMQFDYMGATDILYDLYLGDPNDTKVRSNLVVASVNAGRPDIALEVLKHNNSDEQARKQLNSLMKSVKKNEGRVQTMRLASTEKASPLASNKGHPKSKREQVLSKPNAFTKENGFQPGSHMLDGSVLDPRNLKPGTPSTYRIQVLATYSVIPSDYLNYLKSNFGPVYSYTHGLWKRYCIGSFTDLDQAKSFLDSLDIKGAFIVDYTKKRYVKL